IDEDLVGGKASVRERVLDHATRGAVLHRAAGVREFELQVNLDVGGLWRDALELEERRIADGVGDGGQAARAGGADHDDAPSARGATSATSVRRARHAAAAWRRAAW